VLGGRDLVVGELDRDAHPLEGVDGLAAEVLLDVERGHVEVRPVVERGRVVGVLEQEELHLRVDVEGEAHLRGALEVRLSTVRGSAANGWPSGVRMSQNIRATPCDSGRHGRTWKVEASGTTSMSASWTRAKPSIAEPSKPMPSVKAFSSSAAVIATT
jgi:hypothetical protein